MLQEPRVQEARHDWIASLLHTDGRPLSVGPRAVLLEDMQRLPVCIAAPVRRLVQGLLLVAACSSASACSSAAQPMVPLHTPVSPNAAPFSRASAPVGETEATARPNAPQSAPEQPAQSEYPPVSGAGVIQRGPAPARQAYDEAACRACKGVWGAHGLTGSVGCICATRDGGRSCTGPHECEAECMVDDPMSIAMCAADRRAAMGPTSWVAVRPT